MTLGWNSYHGKIEIFDLKKTPLRYVFSVAENVFLWDWVKVVASQGWMQSNYGTNTNEKKANGGG